MALDFKERAKNVGDTLIARIAVDVDLAAKQEKERLEALSSRLREPALEVLANMGFNEGDLGEVLYQGVCPYDNRLSGYFERYHGLTHIFKAELVGVKNPELVILVNEYSERVPVEEEKPSGKDRKKEAESKKGGSGGKSAKAKVAVKKTEPKIKIVYSVVVLAKEEVKVAGKFKFKTKLAETHTLINRVSDLLPMLSDEKSAGVR